jgi:hypothetical protein
VELGMVIRGHSENGVILLDADIHLPDGTPVTVEVDLTESDLHPDIKRFSGILPKETNAEEMFYERERVRSE